jgi:Ca2+-binding RTX toxin-like protein
MSITKEEALKKLDTGKNIWNAIHVAADYYVKKSSAGKVYLLAQGSAGASIVDTAKNETIDEQLVGIAGDIIGGIVFSTGVGTIVNVALTATGNSMGDHLKSYYQHIKRDVSTQYWDYVQNWKDDFGNTHEYAKIAMHQDFSGNWIPYKDAGRTVFESIYKPEYDRKIDAQNAFYEQLNIESKKLDTQIEEVDGIFKVTLETGEIIAQGDDGVNIINGGNKDDYLDGGAGADTLKGGTGDDTYIANDGDTISDSDGQGTVSFSNTTLIKGVWNSETETYEGDGGEYSLSGSTLTFTKGSQSVTIENYDKENKSLGIELEKSVDIEVYIKVNNVVEE